MLAAALVVFPGGFGTCDELFEISTLRQTQKMHPLPIVLAMREYWEKVIDFKRMVSSGVIDPEGLDLFSHADDAMCIWNSLRGGGLQLR